MSDVADLRGRRRARCAVAVLLLGLVVAFAPGIVAGREFLSVVRWTMRDPLGRALHAEWVDPYIFSPGDSAGTSAIWLVRTEIAWSAVAIALAVVPAIFVAWRCAGFGFGRFVGAGCAVAASAAVIVLVASMRGISDLPDGTWWTVPLGGALMAAAFVVAPAPRRRDE